MLTNIYILKLQDNNYYVGKAKDVNIGHGLSGIIWYG